MARRAVANGPFGLSDRAVCNWRGRGDERHPWDLSKSSGALAPSQSARASHHARVPACSQGLLLLLGLWNFGVLAMVVYVVAGPDSTEHEIGGPAAAA